MNRTRLSPFARALSLTSMAALTALTLTGPNLAEACGGFFCSNVPMDQSGERVLFVAEKLAALRELAQARGLRLPPEAFAYLFLRAPRDMRSLAALLMTIDRYSLEEKRPVTLALLREVLQTPLKL